MEPLADRLARLRGRHHETGERGAVLQWRRARVLAAVRRQAARVGATVDLQVAEDLCCEPGVRITVAPGTHNRLVVGPGCVLRSGVLVQLKGGIVELGAQVQLWRNVRVNAAGHFTAAGHNIFSEGIQVHCADRVEVGEMTILGEYTTIADSSHSHAGPDEWTYHVVRHGTVTIGRNTWVAAKVTIGRGAVVGDRCVLGAHAVVTGTVPDGHRVVAPPPQVRPVAGDG